MVPPLISNNDLLDVFADCRLGGKLFSINISHFTIAIKTSVLTVIPCHIFSFFSGCIQTHCPIIKRADQILPEVYGTTIRAAVSFRFFLYHVHARLYCHRFLSSLYMNKVPEKLD
jgi:hypothetical protein